MAFSKSLGSLPQAIHVRRRSCGRADCVFCSNFDIHLAVALSGSVEQKGGGGREGRGGGCMQRKRGLGAPGGVGGVDTVSEWGVALGVLGAAERVTQFFTNAFSRGAAAHALIRLLPSSSKTTLVLCCEFLSFCPDSWSGNSLQVHTDTRSLYSTSCDLCPAHLRRGLGFLGPYTL